MLKFPGFDAPIFKVLARNDTGAAAGNQAGIVIPKDLEQYFPRLSRDLTAERPTSDAEVRVDLWVGDRFIRSGVTRYQYQTWGGKRLERRVTGGIADWRLKAAEDDVVVFQRSLDDENYYRMILYPSDSLPKEVADSRMRSGSRWGLVFENWEPITNLQITDAELGLLVETLEEPSVYEERAQTEQTVTRAVRSHAFRGAVMKAYSGFCCLTGEAIFAPSGNSSCDAAHIIPVEAAGADIVQNGLALRKDLHWAFDRGLWTLSDDRRVIISKKVNKKINPVLGAIDGLSIAAPIRPDLSPAVAALKWHRQYRLLL